MSNILAAMNHFGDTQPTMAIGLIVLACAFVCIPLAKARG